MNQYNMQTFEDYLDEAFFKNYTGLKDEYEGAFDNWLSSLDNSELMEYADIYGKLMFVKGKTSGLRELVIRLKK